MMDNFPHWVDHIIALVFCIALPLYAARQRTKGTSLIHFSSHQKRVLMKQLIIGKRELHFYQQKKANYQSIFYCASAPVSLKKLFIVVTL